MKGYGQVFLLLLAIGAIFIATSGKGFAIYQLLTGTTSNTGGGIGEPQPKTQEEKVFDWDKAGSGRGGTGTA